MAGRLIKQSERGASASPARRVYPFTAIVGQDEMKLALLLNVIAPTIGGVLIMGQRGTGKSTAVRALAQLLPPITAIRDCPYNCDPHDPDALCRECRRRTQAGERLVKEKKQVPVVDLPLGATEDRVCGTIDIERALKEGVKAFEPGLLARANRGFLYIDEVNLLEDHLVDLMLDAAATGINRVEREGVSEEHPARFVLAGSGNPEEGELRPQFVDRFGLSVEAQTIRDIESRVRIVELREAFERDPARALENAEAELEGLRRRLARAKKSYREVAAPREVLRSIAELCVRVGVDGHRGELAITRAARALAAFEGRKKIVASDARRVAAMCLRHRLRRDPLEIAESGGRIEESLADVFGDDSGGQGNGAARRTDGSGFTPSDSSADPDGGAARKAPERDQRQAQEDSPTQGITEQAERIIPPSLMTLPDEPTERANEHSILNGKARALARQGAGLKRASAAPRGRYALATVEKNSGGRIALDATLRRASVAQAGRDRVVDLKLDVRADDLRYKRFKAKIGALYILAIDTSGSMAQNRIGHAKGAALHLLKKSYLRRDRVAIITFRARAAELVLAPCAAPERAARILEALPIGGATPLASALRRALDIARSAKLRDACAVKLVLFTDGRGNVLHRDGPARDRAHRQRLVQAEIERLGGALQAEGVRSLVVDTMRPFISSGEGESVAKCLGGRRLQLPPTPLWRDCLDQLET